MCGPSPFQLEAVRNLWGISMTSWQPHWTRKKKICAEEWATQLLSPEYPFWVSSYISESKWKAAGGKKSNSEVCYCHIFFTRAFAIINGLMLGLATRSSDWSDPEFPGGWLTVMGWYLWDAKVKLAFLTESNTLSVTPTVHILMLVRMLASMSVNISPNHAHAALRILKLPAVKKRNKIPVYVLVPWEEVWDVRGRCCSREKLK